MLASMLTQLGHFCYIANVAFAESVEFALFHVKFLDCFKYMNFCIFAFLHTSQREPSSTFMHSKYEVLSTEECDLEHSKTVGMPILKQIPLSSDLDLK